MKHNKGILLEGVTHKHEKNYMAIHHFHNDGWLPEQ